MKMLRLMSILMAAAIILAACAVNSDGGNAPYVTQDKLPDAVQAARQDLAATLGVDVQTINVKTYKITDWPDSCLGAADPQEMCLQVITRGYLITLETGGKKYVYHTDATGKGVRMEGRPQAKPAADTSQPTNETGQPTKPASQPAAVDAAVQALATQLGLEPGNVRVVKVEAVDWPDSCLGAGGPQEMCLAVITPGFRVILDTASQSYEVHTDKTGKSTRVIPAAGAATELPVISWQRTGGIAGFCNVLEVFLDGEARASSCLANQSKILGVARLSDDELRQLVDWSGRLGAFDLDQSDPAVADAMSIKLSFAGKGVDPASADEKQAMLTLASSLFQRITGR